MDTNCAFPELRLTLPEPIKWNQGQIRTGQGTAQQGLIKSVGVRCA